MTAIKSQNRLFSIVIPTWNNLAFLKLCIQSIQRNSYYNHQIIVHVNDGSDGTLEWIKKGKCKRLKAKSWRGREGESQNKK